MLFLDIKSLFLKAVNTVKSVIQRNSLIIKATTLAFFSIMFVAVAITALAFSAAPELVDMLESFTQSAFDSENIPSPYTVDFFSLIFLNNVGHLWNPLKMLVWVPFLGPMLLALELPLNSGLIGVVAVIVGANNGLVYPILGLVPHGVIEIPAFLLQFSSIVLWHVTITESIFAKLKGRPVDKAKLKQGLKDVFVLVVASVILLFIAAIIETYVTPSLLGL